MASLSKRVPMLSMKCRTPPSASWPYAVWTAIPTCCGKSAERCAASKRVASACACIAKMTSAPNAWRRCLGRRSASNARKSLTTHSVTTPRILRSGWSRPLNRKHWAPLASIKERPLELKLSSGRDSLTGDWRWREGRSLVVPGLGGHISSNGPKLEAEVAAWIEPCTQRRWPPLSYFVELERAINRVPKPVRWNREDGNYELSLVGAKNLNGVPIRGRTNFYHVRSWR